VRTTTTTAPRRRPSPTVALLSLVAAALAAIAVACGSGEDEAASSTTATSTTVPTTSESTTTAPTTTEPPNDLIAPPPTVVPALDRSNGLAPFVRRVDTTDRVIFITIDDGQVREPTYLDHFEELGVPFTSFLTLPMAQADPEFWKGTLERGGLIETHTIKHPNLRTVGEATVRREVCEPADAFAEMFGRRPTLFRPPYGNSNDTVRRIANECGYAAVVHWTGSTNNGKLTMQDVVLQPGDIILMHYRDTLHADLGDVVARARAEGFKIGRLEDYLLPAS
jgi:peptidoglycan/xylan/chitin deacetylase (PgdA/CDA1 family)